MFNFWLYEIVEWHWKARGKMIAFCLLFDVMDSSNYGWCSAQRALADWRCNLSNAEKYCRIRLRGWELLNIIKYIYKGNALAFHRNFRYNCPTRFKLLQISTTLEFSLSQTQSNCYCVTFGNLAAITPRSQVLISCRLLIFWVIRIFILLALFIFLLPR